MGRPPHQASKQKTRALARATNAPDMLAHVDGRSAVARRFKDIAGALISDQGGADRLSEARLQLVRRLAGLCVLAESIESKIATGGGVDLTAYGQLCNTMSRIATRLGLNRVAKEVPNLQNYLAQRSGNAFPAAVAHVAASKSEETA
jgi:hypothetical protein